MRVKLERAEGRSGKTTAQLVTLPVNELAELSEREVTSSEGARVRFITRLWKD